MSSPPPSFDRAPGHARKIIVVDFGFLGDTIHLIPALWELHRHYPQAGLHVLTTPVGAEVLQLVPCVERAWPVELDRQRRTWRQQGQTLRGLRRERFDLAFNFSGADRTIIWTALSGARWRVAHPGRKHFWNSWLVPNWVPRQPAGMPVFEQRRQVLAACGLNLAPPKWNFAVPEPVRNQVAAGVPTGAIHLSVCASTPLKEWPLENWIAFVRRLLVLHPHLPIVVTGSHQPRERERLELLAAAIRSENLKPMIGLRIAELAAVLQRCQLHVGADSGVLHLAVAQGRPTISLFRNYHDASAWTPTGELHHVFKQPCVCVNRREAPCASAQRAECLAQLAVEPVITAVNKRLQLTAHGTSQPH